MRVRAATLGARYRRTREPFKSWISTAHLHGAELSRKRPTLKRIPSEANLRRAYKQLTDIKKRIELGTFNFEEEFPHYRFKGNLITTDADVRRQKESCDEVFDKFIAFCEHRVSKDDMALSTLSGYRESAA